MKAIIFVEDQLDSADRIFSCPAPLLPLAGRPLFSLTAQKLSAAGVNQVLFVGGEDLTAIEKEFGDGRNISLHVRYLHRGVDGFRDRLTNWASKGTLLILPDNIYLGAGDIRLIRKSLGKDDSAVRAVNRLKFTEYQERIVHESLECHRYYQGYDDDQWAGGSPGEFYAVAGRFTKQIADDLSRGSFQRAFGFGDRKDWVDVPVGGRRVVAEDDYFELNRRLVLQSLPVAETEANGNGGNGRTLMMGAATVGKSARLRGPIVIGEGAVIEDGATILGPAVIGPSAVVRRGASVIESVIWAGSSVEGAQRICHSIVKPDGIVQIERRPILAATDEMSLSRHSAPARTAPTSEAQEVGRWFYWAGRRLVDVIGAALVLIAASPLLALTALAIRMETKGSIFFRHRRQGRHGKEFDCIKFRSMREDTHLLQRTLQECNVEDGPQFKISDDPRVTRVGRIIRRTNIDELPQLWNVLRGQMSLIGPRPSPHSENQFCPAWREIRLSVRPGITGLWQVCRSAEDQRGFHEWIQYDIEYVTSASWRLDAWIAWRTCVVLGSGVVRPIWKAMGGMLRPIRNRLSGSRVKRAKPESTSPNGRSGAGMYGPVAGHQSAQGGGGS
jgi:lipopolysaccharide/colanic/teichoic acid biosynthesis glycosyltransferase/NDP-sugar pyrophosphorylase family protein